VEALAVFMTSSVNNMDIYSVINFLSQLVSKSPNYVEDSSVAACEKKLDRDLARNVFSISNTCFDSIRNSEGLPKVKSDYLIVVNYKNILILKQTKDKSVPIFSIIGGLNTKITEIEYAFPIENSDFILLKNKNESQLLVFNYKIAGNINPFRVLPLSHEINATRANYDQSTREITFFDQKDNKESVSLDGKLPFNIKKDI
jgi:hypothetical protein